MWRGSFQAFVTSDVLIGAGLSSSAAFETLMGTILSELFNDGKISPIEIAMIGQFAENVYFWKSCGLMDQMACSVGSLAHIDFQNPAAPLVERIEFDLDGYGYSLCITDTKGSHADWAEKWLPNYEITEGNLHAIVQKEIGFVFAKVLECAGVYKRTPEGQAAFKKNFGVHIKKGPFHICEVVCFFGIQFSQIVLLARLCMIYMLKVSFIES